MPRSGNIITTDPVIWGLDADEHTGRDVNRDKNKDVQDQKNIENSKSKAEKKTAEEIAKEGLDANQITNQESRRSE